MSLNALKIVKYKIITAVLPQHVFPFPRNYRDFCPHLHSVTVRLVPIPAVLPWALSPLPRSIRGYRGITVIPIPVQLSTLLLTLLSSTGLPLPIVIPIALLGTLWGLSFNLKMADTMMAHLHCSRYFFCTVLLCFMYLTSCNWYVQEIRRISDELGNMNSTLRGQLDRLMAETSVRQVGTLFIFHTI